ncbi:hypothetical protein [Pseudorhodoferax sp.]|uniref:hypothetical protein n=1 Tax=Pseudorhodoferax sp. TaxID=1993553 RepID=UPI0039E5B279
MGAIGERAISAATAVAILVGATGCATASKDITAAYVSPIQYDRFDCDQIAAENQRLSARVAQLGGRLDEAASNDKAITGVGLILFWPALFALGGTKQQEAEYSRLKGEHDALQQSAVLKRCGASTPADPTVAVSQPADQKPAAVQMVAQ